MEIKVILHEICRFVMHALCFGVLSNGYIPRSSIWNQDKEIFSPSFFLFYFLSILIC